MENKKTVDQNPGEVVSPEENINVVEETAKSTDDGKDIKKSASAEAPADEKPKTEEVAEDGKSKIEDQKSKIEDRKSKIEDQKSTIDNRQSTISTPAPEAEPTSAEAPADEKPKTEEVAEDGKSKIEDQKSKIEDRQSTIDNRQSTTSTPEPGPLPPAPEAEPTSAEAPADEKPKTEEVAEDGKSKIEDQKSKIEDRQSTIDNRQSTTSTPEPGPLPPAPEAEPTSAEAPADEKPKTEEVAEDGKSKIEDQKSKIEDRQSTIDNRQSTTSTPEPGPLPPAPVNEKAEVSPKDTVGVEEDDENEDEHETFEEYTADELVNSLEELVQIKDITSVKTRIALIKVAFIKFLKEEKQAALDKFLEEGGNKDDYKPLEIEHEKRFNKAFEVYRRNKVKFNEQQEKIKLINLDKKKEILEKIKVLIISEETLKKTYDEFKVLQTEWKEIGMVPSGEVSNLWQCYHFLVEKFFDKVKINKELRNLDMKKNLELKIELCEKTEELLIETSIIKSFKQLQKYHEEWKAIGPVPQEQNDEIWERLKAATDRINERRREHYGKMQEEQEQNLLAKSGLCEQIETLISTIPDNMKGWQEKTNAVNELFNVWRSIGRAPKKENTEVWNRFKGSMNTFFANKKEFLNSIKQEQMNNYNMKVDLCLEAETQKDSTEWKRTTQELIRLQQDWKKIGPIPRKHSDKIWKRFRAACDEFFNNKASHFSNIHGNEQENLEKKKELIKNIKSFDFGEDKSKNLDILKNFQRDWMEIGYVPMKDKEIVQKQFRETIDARLDDLKISSAELSNASYANRMEAIKDSPDANRVYRKEIIFLTNKISKLSDDIILWENNLGFFANSKKADILKQEFEQKLDKSKQDLAAMEAKVKYLRRMTSE